jgi:sodium-coupled neutral amino acid transporter 11
MKKDTEQSFLMKNTKNSDDHDNTTGEENEIEEASKLSTSFNYINSILGSGIIGMPYALRNAGIGLGMILFIIVSLLSNYTLRLMIRNGELAGSSSYQGVMTTCFGRTGFVITSIMQFLFPFLSMVGFNVAAGDTLSKVFGAFIGEDPQTSSLLFLNRKLIIAVTSITILLPLSLYRKISKLSRASLVSSLSILFIIFSVYIRYLSLGPSLSDAAHSIDLFNWSGAPKAVGLMVFSYTCHHNSLLLYSCMKEKTEEAWAKGAFKYYISAEGGGGGSDLNCLCW